jgi:hypothetical protein
MPTLLQPDAERITPLEHTPTHDGAPEGLALGTPLWLQDDLVDMLGKDQVHDLFAADFVFSDVHRRLIYQTSFNYYFF